MEEKNYDGKTINVHQDKDGEIWLHFINNNATIMIFSDKWDKVKEDLITILERF